MTKARLTLEIESIDVVLDGDVAKSGNGGVVNAPLKKYIGRRAKILVLRAGA